MGYTGASTVLWSYDYEQKDVAISLVNWLWYHLWIGPCELVVMSRSDIIIRKCIQQVCNFALVKWMWVKLFP